MPQTLIIQQKPPKKSLNSRAQSYQDKLSLDKFSVKNLKNLNPQFFSENEKFCNKYFGVAGRTDVWKYYYIKSSRLKWSWFWMVGTKTPTSKSLEFEWFWILNGQILDPHCIYTTVKSFFHRVITSTWFLSWTLILQPLMILNLVGSILTNEASEWLTQSTASFAAIGLPNGSPRGIKG